MPCNWDAQDMIVLKRQDLLCRYLAHHDVESVGINTQSLIGVAGGSKRGSSGCREHWKSRRLTGSSRQARRLSSKRRRKRPSLLMTFTALYATSPSRARRP